MYRFFKGIPQEVASRPLDELQKMTVAKIFCSMLRNEVMSLHGGEMNDLASCLINRARVGSQVVKANDIPME